jgi:hypothetical protein
MAAGSGSYPTQAPFPASTAGALQAGTSRRLTGSTFVPRRCFPDLAKVALLAAGALRVLRARPVLLVLERALRASA